MTEFTIEHYPGMLFRDTEVSPVELLALSTQVDFDRFEKTKELFLFALEHVECKVNDTWVKVKYPGREIYMPEDIKTNFRALNDICVWYMTNVIGAVFPESAE